MGCFSKGCLTLLGLLVFLGLALVAGSFWGIHYLRGYSATAPLPPPPVVEPTARVAPPVEDPPLALPATPPASPITRDDLRQLERDWKDFEQAAKRREAVLIELTAADINALIAGSEAKDQVFVSIENNLGTLQFSVPLNQIFMMDGRYLNGTATIQASPDGDPTKVRISNIVLGGRAVAESVLDQGMFGWPSIRTFVSDWLTKQRIASFRIENNRVIGETRGDR